MYVKIVSYWDSHIKLISKCGEIFHLGVQDAQAMTLCHPPGGNNVMVGALKFVNTRAENGVGIQARVPP